MKGTRWWYWQHRLAPYLFVLPFLLLFTVFMLYPLGRSLMLSFYKTAGPRNQTFVGLDNYRFLLRHDWFFLLALVNTTAFTVLYLLVQVPASLGLAMLLNSRLVACRNLFRFCFFSSYLVGPVFVGVLFSQLFPAYWLSSPAMAMPTLLIASWWLSIGFGMIYFLAALQAVDNQLYQAAQVDGAGVWGSFWHVTLPSIRPVLIFVILVGTIGGFQLFELPYVLFQGPGPSARALTLVMYLFSAGFDSGDLGYASAIGWVLVLILLIVSIAQLKLTKATADI